MFPDWEWCVLTLPPRHFSWRVRGNPLYWSISERETLEADYDLLLVTSMVDLACLRGLVPRLALLPSVVYFHENQFEYPQGRDQNSLVEAQMVSLYSALAADCITFNSVFNRDSFLRGCGQLLHRLPDKVPMGVVQLLEKKSVVLPVPLGAAVSPVKATWPGGTTGEYPHRPVRLLWVGRFEHDKGGDQLKRILAELKDRNFDFELAVVGQQFRASPPVFAEIECEFKDHLVQFGYVEKASAFQELLSGADIVLSTALHEFQGLAVLEAITAGCIPVVPNRLVYPEILPASFCYPCSPQDELGEAKRAAKLIEATAQGLAQGTVVAPDVSMFSRGVLLTGYSALFLRVSGLEQ